jgi:hypothetical protein
MTNKIKYIIFFFLLIYVNSCKQYFIDVTEQYKASQYIQKAESKIKSCLEEYYQYHPNAYDLDIRSKVCSRVKNRICVINNYCKEDKECIEKAWRIYSDEFTTGSDEAYCLSFVKEVKEDNEKNQRFKGYFYCKTDKRDDEFCKKHGI